MSLGNHGGCETIRIVSAGPGVLRWGLSLAWRKIARLQSNLEHLLHLLHLLVPTPSCRSSKYSLFLSVETRPLWLGSTPIDPRIATSTREAETRPWRERATAR
jgi:hypothetical protein